MSPLHTKIISLEIIVLNNFWEILMHKTSHFLENPVASHIENYSQTDSSKCINFVDKLVVNSLFWKLFFDGYKSNDGVGQVVY